MKVCTGDPEKASINRITGPFVVMSIFLPSALNLRLVQSQSLSWGNLNVVNGPCVGEQNMYVSTDSIVKYTTIKLLSM